MFFKRSKKLVSIVMVFTLVFGMGLSVFADGESSTSFLLNDIEFAKSRAEIFIKNTGRSTKITNPILLKNLNQEYEAVAFSISENGYIIVNLKDLSIPELSFETPNPFLGVKNPIYNGILAYYKKQGNEILSIKDESSFKKNEFEIVYSKSEVNDKEAFLKKISFDLMSKSRRSYFEKYINGSLKEWYVSGGHCGAIACAICLRYYYDYVNTGYVPSGIVDKYSMIAKMMNFTGSGGTSTTALLNGLNNYFNSISIKNSAFSKGNFSFYEIRNQINNNRPVIVGTHHHPTFNNHWIIAHGYFEKVYGVPYTKYIIVNNGWGDNNIWVECNTQNLDETIYFDN